ncbi:hypothetical protein [Rhodococcus pyridinivorans]|uniref:hypothetical protein n=1 Tax=Rhodococcus pyridinivorans TaxID=103816 RepID=UPI00228424B5|nr:hypothetical protein [Rhodococcus pyridinivorans]WAL49698.1 hypothetical protein OQN32_27180 [Rhodococcus pyridinivorans]
MTENTIGSAPNATVTGTPTTVFTEQQILHFNRFLDRVDRDIEDLLADQRRVVGYGFAAAVRSAVPHATSATALLTSAGQIGVVYAISDGNLVQVPGSVIGTDLRQGLLSVMRRLPTGLGGGPWHRGGGTLNLAFTPEIIGQAPIPFTTIQDLLVDALERVTNRTIRRIVITTELWDNGYHFDDTLAVDFTDGDGDEIYYENLCDYTPELREHTGDLGPCTVVTITRTADGITID